jgi:hypothetical protein
VKKVWVFELVPMDLFNKVEEIAMTSLFVLYSTNIVPLVISALPLCTNPKQQGFNAKEEPQEEEIFIPTRRKKNMKKLACKVVIK